MTTTKLPLATADGRCTHHKPWRPEGGLAPNACALGLSARTMYRAAIGPCVTMAGREDRTSLCASWSPVPADVLAAERAEDSAAVAAFVAGRCPECGAELEQKVVAGGRATIFQCPTHGVVARGCGGARGGDHGSR